MAGFAKAALRSRLFALRNCCFLMLAMREEVMACRVVRKETCNHFRHTSSFSAAARVRGSSGNDLSF